MENLQLTLFEPYEHPFVTSIFNSFPESESDEIEYKSAAGGFPDELNILAICQIEGEVTNNRLQESINKHRTDITKILQELCKQGFLISENKSRWTTYRLNTENPTDTSVIKMDTSAANMDTSAANMDTSAANMDTSVINMDTSAANMDTSAANVDTSAANMDTLKLSTNKKRFSKKELEGLILEICQSEYKSLEEIGIIIKKTPKYLKNDVIAPMIEQGKLVRLHSKINHPNQAYKAANKQ